MTDDALFDATSLNDLSLSNRVGLAPMTRISATDEGLATNEMAHYYRKFADGGFGFLVTEGVYTDDAYSQGYLNQPGLVTDDHVEAWTTVTDAVHEVDTPIFAQLMHAGAQSQGNPHLDGDRTLAPSAVQPDGQKAEAYGGSGEFAVPKAADETDLETAREGFVRAATNAVEAGFDGVELHGANGYLLNEFLAADANRRDDEYGGGPESRVKFPAEVLSAVTDAVPEEFVVGIRVSQEKVTDGDYEWPEGEDAAAVFFEELSAAGADYVHTTETDATTPTFGADGPTLVEAAAEYVTDDTVVIANGGLGGPDAARAAVDAGADLFTLGTSALANPDWPARVAAGDDLDAFDPAKYLAPTAGLSDHEVPSEPPLADD
ncbi:MULTISPECIES: oxidoreductase [Haloferax]|uniref:NADH:flavin oxidoreductase n=1 Tax=Haloferax sp. Atlit-48N TaxID=2077198 RepID=A0ACD5HYK9_9EURY|nr:MULTISPECIES: NADH:flavin oxidoreductase [Haloferax]RDZ29973.1 NADH:flavin oxidoreductase [Haloferax sp. Atlit-48N]